MGLKHLWNRIFNRAEDKPNLQINQQQYPPPKARQYLLRMGDGTSYYAGPGLAWNHPRTTHNPDEAMHFADRWDAVEAAGRNPIFAGASVVPYFPIVRDVAAKGTIAT
jgi:hypothetical protein